MYVILRNLLFCIQDWQSYMYHLQAASFMCNGKEDQIRLTPTQIGDVNDVGFSGLLKVKNGKKKRSK